MSEPVRRRKTQARVVLGTILALTLTAGGTASALNINLTYDPDSTFTNAGLTAADITNMKAAMTYSASQLTSRYTDPIDVNIKVTAVPGTGTLGMSSTFLAFAGTYANLRNAMVADSTTADDATQLAAGGSLPAADPIGGTHDYIVSRAEAKALGIIANDLSNDGTFTFGGGFSYTYDSNNRAVAGKFDFIGVAMHELTEIMGRIGLMGENLTGNPDYMLHDLHHYTGASVRGLNDGAGRFFSINNGTTLLKAFNNAAVNGGDLQDWASGTNDTFNAFSSAGVQNDLTPVDLRVMDVIGYDLGTSTTQTLTVATSNPNSGVSIQVSPNDNNGAGDGITQFTRTYNNNTIVSLTAPSTANGNTFQKWQRDGSDWDMNSLTNVTMDASHTMTAVYSGIQLSQPDFNSDGRADLVWQNASNNQVQFWFMDGQGNKMGAKYLNNGQNFGSWRVVGGAELNSDGLTDLFWQNSSTNQVQFWWMDGHGNKGGAKYLDNGQNFGSLRLVGAADLNSDGKADLIWQDATSNQVQFWFMDGHGNRTAFRYLNNGVNFSTWKVIGAEDLNSDGIADLIWQNSSNNEVQFWFMDGHGNKSGAKYLNNGQNFGAWKVKGAADLNNDGKADLVWQNASNNQVQFWFMDGQGNKSGAKYLNNGQNFGAWKVKP
jgi:hypothetical protein